MARSSNIAKPDLTLDRIYLSRAKKRSKRIFLSFIFLGLIIVIGLVYLLFLAPSGSKPSLTEERLKAQGRSLYQAKRYGQAAERLSLYVSMKPRDWRAREMLADSYWRTGATVKAFNELRAVGRYTGPEGDRLYRLGLLAGQLGRKPTAVAMLAEAVKADRRSLLFRVELAKALVKTRDFDRAIMEWEAALKLLPDRDLYSAVIYAELGDVFKQKGDSDKAKEAYRRGLEVEPANAYLQAQAAKADG